MHKSFAPSRLLSLAVISLSILFQPAGAKAGTSPDVWDTDPAARESVTIAPVRETALARADSRSSATLRLALKRYAHPGAQPVLLIHGLAQNDRIWDSPIARFSFARYLHSRGFDVWIGNERAAGTDGFRSETPDGPHHWTVEDYAALDLPALVAKVRQATGRAPFLVGHSLAAWAFDGYLAGLEYDSRGHARPNAARARLQQASVRGVVTIAGIYNVWWPNTVWHAIDSPVTNEKEYYQSNYELELLAHATPLYEIVPRLPALPLDWMGRVLMMPLDQIPWIGDALALAYRGFQSGVIRTPVFNMFYYAPDSDPEMVRLHVLDGMEDLGPKLMEQLANAVNEKATLTHYHGSRPDDAYAYASVRSQLRLPLLMVGGGRDRLANYQMIYRDGYQASGSRDKTYLPVEKFGHLDILTGRNAPREVMLPVANWLQARSY